MKYLLSILTLSVLHSAAGQETILAYRKGPCMGKCQVYEINVNANRVLTFNAIRHLNPTGTFTRQLTRKEFRKLNRLFRRAKIENLEREYDSRLMDASSTKVSFKRNEIVYHLEYKISKPSEAFDNAENYLVSLTPLQSPAKFEFTASDTKDTLVDRASLRSPIASRKESANNTLIVELKSPSLIENLIISYRKYNLSIVKQLSPDRPIYLLLYDPKMIRIEALLNILEQDKSILNVQQNRKTQLR